MEKTKTIPDEPAADLAAAKPANLELSRIVPDVELSESYSDSNRQSVRSLERPFAEQLQRIVGRAAYKGRVSAVAAATAAAIKTNDSIENSSYPYIKTLGN